MVRTQHQQELLAQYDEIKRAIGVGNNSFAIVSRLLTTNRADMAVDDVGAKHMNLACVGRSCCELAAQSTF